MFVDVGDTAPPQLRATEDLGALSVRVGGGTADWRDLARTLGAADAGIVSDGHVWLEVGWLRAAAGQQDEQWYAAFAAMLDYALLHSWLSSDGRRVRAHVDWSPGA